MNHFSSIVRCILGTLFFFSTISYAAVFSIVPQTGTPLPAKVPINGSANAYTITNTTGATHLNNYIKTLPPNVTQIVSAGTCGKTFNLAAGESCILKLKITGPVNGSDPNPKNHLFACLGGCVTCCAGTRYPLNVVTTPIQYAYVVNQSGTVGISLCQVINNSFVNCKPTGNGFSGANAAVFNQDASYVYVSNSGTDTISACPVNPDYTLGTCVTYSDPSFNLVDGMAFNATGNYLYITNFFGNSVSICPVNTLTHALGTCSVQTGFDNPASIRLNTAGTYAYISNYSLSVSNNSTITTCIVNPNHSLGNCSSSIPGTLDNSDGISSIINNTIYVSNNAPGANSITLCPITGNNYITNCNSPTLIPQLNGPNTITFNESATYAYITNAVSNNITVCAINKNGEIGICTNDSAIFSAPHGILLQ